MKNGNQTNHNSNRHTELDDAIEEAMPRFNSKHEERMKNRNSRVACLLSAAVVAAVSMAGVAALGSKTADKINAQDNEMEQTYNKSGSKETFTYIVKEGDIGWLLIKQFYGEEYDARYIEELVEKLTRKGDPSFSLGNIHIGQKICFPVLE